MTWTSPQHTDQHTARYDDNRSRGGMFPFPHRSWRTKGGTSVTVGGCCLPIPLGFVAVIGAGAAAAHQFLDLGSIV